MWRALKEFVVIEKLIKLSKITTSNSKNCVKRQDYTSELLEISNSLRQGDKLSPELFNTALKKVIRAINVETYKTIWNK